ncbi:hypothetical protein ACFW6V_09710 [Streptomyces sp. NPDC058734]|uniref:hypothetical protein n=1 Tax=Streptomyces sp. NPDC058734 TaxID=3346615 RepID=UPI0036A228CB
MTIHTLRRRLASLGTVLGLGIALPFAVGVTPAYAQPRLDITKTHSGDFTRGGQAEYRIRVTNSGDQTTFGSTRLTDTLPAGLTLVGVTVTEFGSANVICVEQGNGVECLSGVLGAGVGYELTVTVAVAADAPCTVSNTASVVDVSSALGATATDTTAIPGPGCGGEGEGGTSVLPVSLSGLIPIYNNINTGGNVLSPGATNANSQTFSANATP